MLFTSGIVTLIAVLVAFRFISRRQRQLLQTSTEEASVAKEARTNPNRDADADDEEESSSEDGGADDEDYEREPGDGSTKPDPMEFCEHIQSEVKKARHAAVVKSTIGQMSPEEKETEHEIQRKQLEAIYKLMAEQNEKFGVNSMDQIQEQMKLYA